MNPRVKKLMGKMHADSGNLTPREKVERWFGVTSSEGYDCHDAILGKLLKLEDVIVEPTPNDPNNSKTIFSFTVPRELCSE
ncbi:hypothetical protein ACN47E_000410 [Coniothyrium glycines]